MQELAGVPDAGDVRIEIPAQFLSRSLFRWLLLLVLMDGWRFRGKALKFPGRRRELMLGQGAAGWKETLGPRLVTVVTDGCGNLLRYAAPGILFLLGAAVCLGVAVSFAIRAEGQLMATDALYADLFAILGPADGTALRGEVALGGNQQPEFPVVTQACLKFVL